MSIATRLNRGAELPQLVAASEPLVDPDPRLAASLYCAGRLDRVIHEVVAPFQRELRGIDVNGSYQLWMLRYSRGGEHLKIRVHGPPQHGPFLRERLDSVAQKFLAELSNSAEPVSRRTGAPAVDEADLEEGGHQDRTLVWTIHRRSPVVLGDPALLGDDTYVARFTACLGAGCEAVLNAFEPDSTGKVSFRRRQSILSRLLMAGVGAVFPTLSEQRAFLAYHRNWVVRSLILRAGASLEKAQAVLERFRAEAERMGPGGLAPLTKLVDSLVIPGRKISPYEAAWCSSLTELRSFLDPLNRDLGFDVDPFAEGLLFPTLFKVFQGVANPLGVSPLNEALTHDLLLRATGEDDFVERFKLIPI